MPGIKPGMTGAAHLVIAGLDPAIHTTFASAWTTGSSPVVTLRIFDAFVDAHALLNRKLTKHAADFFGDFTPELLVIAWLDVAAHIVVRGI
jgi:hypothetical protein